MGDLDFADDLALPPHSQNRMQEKTTTILTKLGMTWPNYDQRKE